MSGKQNVYSIEPRPVAQTTSLRMVASPSVNYAYVISRVAYNEAGEVQHPFSFHVALPEEGSRTAVIALFALQREEDGSLIFSDQYGAAFGCGENLDDAVADYLGAAHHLKEAFRERPRLHARVAVRVNFFKQILKRDGLVSAEER